MTSSCTACGQIDVTGGLMPEGLIDSSAAALKMIDGLTHRCNNRWGTTGKVEVKVDRRPPMRRY